MPPFFYYNIQVWIAKCMVAIFHHDARRRWLLHSLHCTPVQTKNVSARPWHNLKGYQPRPGPARYKQNVAGTHKKCTRRPRYQQKMFAGTNNNVPRQRGSWYKQKCTQDRARCKCLNHWRYPAPRGYMVVHIWTLALRQESWFHVEIIPLINASQLLLRPSDSSMRV
jgi:hypothetical protein